MERTQRTDWEEFYSLADLKSPTLAGQLQEWEDYYNRERRHGSIGKAPWQKWEELADRVPCPDIVRELYLQKKEYIKHNRANKIWQP